MDTWTKDNIIAGMEHFRKENGNYPTVTEIDQTTYLPSSRQIQRKFGGLKKFREQSGFSTTDFSSGQERSVIASRAGLKGRVGEKLVEKILVEHFGKEFVHIEQIWGDTKQRLDFFIYSPGGNFGVEVISASEKDSFTINLNIKIRRYGNVATEVLIVAVGQQFTQDFLELLMSRKRLRLPHRTKVLSLDKFIETISTMPRFHAHP